MSERIPAFYIARNIGNHPVIGMITKYKYGHFGGGTNIPGGAYPEDIRARPDRFACGKCRSRFTITPTGEVICPNCDRAGVGQLLTGGVVRDETFLNRPVDLPPPVRIVPREAKTVPASVPSGVNIASLDFGSYSHDRYVRLLEENGIITLDDAVQAGLSGMTAIKGIGTIVAKAILSYAE